MLGPACGKRFDETPAKRGCGLLVRLRLGGHPMGKADDVVTVTVGDFELPFQSRPVCVSCQLRIDGVDLDGLTVELAGDVPGEQQQTWARPGRSSGDTLRFSLPAGLPSGAWVLVRRGLEWLDRRFLTWPWARGLEKGVEVEVPAQTKIETLIANRESPNVEFKRQVPTDEDSKARVTKTVCAFANGDGGSILFGIDDDYRLVGLPAAKASSLIDQITQLIDNWVEPTPPCSFDLLEVENADTVIIELIVSAGSRLYGSSKPNEPSRVYVRHYARSVPARVSEIEGIAHARGGQSPAWPHS